MIKKTLDVIGETKFTDDNLARLKESLETYEDEQQQCYRVKEFKALLARLEAAEKLIGSLIRNHDWVMAARPDLEAWGKAAGKDSPTA
jgi:hypothetical protein